MSTFVAGLRREPAALLILGAMFALATAVQTGSKVAVVAPILVIMSVFAVAHRRLLQWHSLVGAVLLVVLFVPIKRYALPGSLPFHFELYRLAVMLVVLAWLTSLLIDPRVQLQRTVFDAPLLLICAWTLGSEIANPGRVDQLSSYVAKGLTFFLSFVLVYYVITSVVNTRKQVNFLLKMFVVGTTMVSVAAVIEQRSGYNVFFHLHTVLPFLHFEGGAELSRFGRLRVYGPAQHPIALGATLVVPIPIAVYFSQTRGRIWWLAVGLLVLGALATGSRTAIIMLVTMTIVFLRLKPAETGRLWPALLPMIVLVHALLPGAIGGLKNAFFPPGGIIQEQTTLARGADPYLAGGRVRQLRPMLREAAHHPFFGEGYSTRITGFESKFRNAPILDNQWLNNVLELGYIGGGIWIWLFIRAVRRLMRASRRADEDGDDWLFTGLAASLAGFGIGMFTFDAFGFIQITFLFWILLALAAVALRLADVTVPEARSLVWARLARSTG